MTLNSVKSNFQFFVDHAEKILLLFKNLCGRDVHIGHQWSFEDLGIKDKKIFIRNIERLTAGQVDRAQRLKLFSAKLTQVFSEASLGETLPPRSRVNLRVLQNANKQVQSSEITSLTDLLFALRKKLVLSRQAGKIDKKKKKKIDLENEDFLNFVQTYDTNTLDNYLEDSKRGSGFGLDSVGHDYSNIGNEAKDFHGGMSRRLRFRNKERTIKFENVFGSSK